MASILPTCPRCGSHRISIRYTDPQTKRKQYRCLECYKDFKEMFTSAVYTAPMGEPADNGKPVLCNEQTEKHDATCPRCHMPDNSFVEHSCDNSLGHVETRRCRHCKTAFSTIDGIAQRINKIGNTLEQDMRLEIGDMIYGGLG